MAFIIINFIIILNKWNLCKHLFTKTRNNKILKNKNEFEIIE